MFNIQLLFLFALLYSEEYLQGTGPAGSLLLVWPIQGLQLRQDCKIHPMANKKGRAPEAVLEKEEST